MDELIARLEKATGPDGALNRAIADAVFDLEWKPYGPRARKCWGYPRGSEYAKFYGEDSIPQYTASIDAALTLVPDGVGWILSRHDENGAHWAEVGEPWQYTGATAAIAICIAALKARNSLTATQRGV